MYVRIITLLVLLSPKCWVTAQDFMNLGFEFIEEETQFAEKWIVVEENDCNFTLDKNMAYDGNMSFLLTQTQLNSNCSATILNGLKKELFKNKKTIRITGFVRSADKSKAPFLSIICKQLSNAGTEILKPFVTHVDEFPTRVNWHKYAFEQEIDTATEFLAIGINASLIDSVWIDNFDILIDDDILIDSNPPPLPILTKKEVNWLDQNVIPIKTVDPLGSIDELNFLKDNLVDYPIVALGEVTHGSSEIYKLKHRLLKFLFSKMNFTMLAMEMNMSEAHALNDYVLNDKGNPEDLLSAISYWTWNTEEFLEIVKWMNNFNKTHTEKIQITGFDIPFSSSSLLIVREFAAKNDIILLGQIDSLKVLIDKADLNSNNKADGHYLLTKIENLLRYARMRKEKMSLSSSTKENDWIEQNIIILKQSVLYEINKNENSNFFREQCMAENIDWLVKNNRSAKIILWAHNGHVGKGQGAMGDFLQKKHAFFSIGFALGNGYFNAKSMISDNSIDKHLLIPPINDSYEYYFSKSKYPIWFLNLNNTITNTSGNGWWLKPHKFRFVGSVVTRYQFTYTNLLEEFDAILYIKSSTPSELLFQKN